MADGIKLKQERGEEEDPMVDPDAVEDDDDDAGDLEFYDKNVTDPNLNNMYLARVPAYVWEAWDKLPDNEELEIGTIRQWQETDAMGNTQIRLRMLLHNKYGQHQSIPKEYDLKITEMTVKDTFLFSEEDLPHFKEKNKQRQAASAAGIPAHLLRSKVEKPAAPKQRGGRRGPRREFYRKAIPKKTTIAGRVAHELNCIPVENAETDHLLAVRALEASKPKSKVKFQDEDPNIKLRQLNMTLEAQQRMHNFIKARAPPPPTKQKKMEMKTARIPQNELLDKIFQCFRRYNHWPFKRLRHELQQPEAYLRETLELVAELQKTGNASFNNTWRLTEDSKRSNAIPEMEDTVAPDTAGDLDDEDADVKMEDVL